jgi:cytoskeleton protein RodZ
MSNSDVDEMDGEMDDDIVDEISENKPKDNTSGSTSKATDDFGSILATARKIQNHTIGEITEHLKIPARIITALEENDLAALPEAIFTQGYLRTYARFLEVSEDDVLAAYNRAIPHDQSAELKTSSSMPNETNSQSPLVKLVTIALLFAGLAAAIYAGYQYYQEKADIMENERESKARVFTGNSLDSPGTKRLNIKQNARLSEDGELLLGNDGNESEASVLNLNPAAEPAAEIVAPKNDVADTGAGLKEQQEKNSSKLDSRQQTEPKKAVVNIDVIEIIAEEDAWLDVRDASSTRLFYNILKQGRSKSLKGRAPFNVSLGNARTTRVLINGIEVDMQRYIRRSNTARFVVSSEQDKVIFH